MLGRVYWPNEENLYPTTITLNIDRYMYLYRHNWNITHTLHGSDPHTVSITTSIPCNHTYITTTFQIITDNMSTINSSKHNNPKPSRLSKVPLDRCPRPPDRIHPYSLPSLTLAILSFSDDALFLFYTMKKLPEEA